MLPGERFEEVIHLLLGDRLDDSVALHTPGEGPRSISQVGPAHHLHYLRHRHHLTNQVSVHDHGPLQQITIPGEHDAILGHGELGQIAIIESSIADCIETNESEVIG